MSKRFASIIVFVNLLIGGLMGCNSSLRIVIRKQKIIQPILSPLFTFLSALNKTTSFC